MISPSLLTAIVQPTTGAPARLSLAARSAGVRSPNSARGTVHRDQRCRLGQAIDLDELPAEFGLGALDRARRRGSARDDDPDAAATGNRATGVGLPRRCGVEDHVEHRRGAAHEGDAVFLDTPEDLGTVDLADDDVLGAHPGDGIEHAPPVAVELGERVQVHVTIAHAHVPAEDAGVQPQVAMRELHAFRARGGAGGVVDRGRGVLVGLPRLRFHAESHHRRVGVGADDQLVLALDVGHRVGQLGIDQQHPRPGMGDDVLDLLGDESEVDRHEHPTRPGDPEQRREQPGRVVADHRHPFADADAQRVEPSGHRPCPFRHLAVRDRAPRLRRLIRFVDDRDPVGVDELGSPQEVVDGQCHLHGGNLRR